MKLFAAGLTLGFCAGWIGGWQNAFFGKNIPRRFF